MISYKTVLLILCVSIFSKVTAKYYKTNITDFSKCSVYYSRSGNTYKDFFEIPPQENYENGSLLDFHFSVLASSDAHIMFAPSVNVNKDDPAYEIVIGAGGNTFCDIRRMQKSEVKASVRIKNLLSGLDVQSFWIHISKDGVISVGREGEELGFIEWIDPDPLPLKVFSFSTWPGIEAKYFFSCLRSNNSEANKVVKELTSLEKLRLDLLYGYDPYVQPLLKNTTVKIVVNVSIRNDFVNYDSHHSTFEYKGQIHMRWYDEKLKWSPSNYSGLKNLLIFRREIWIPEIFCSNSIGNSAEILEDSMISVNSLGIVDWRTPLNIFAWCNPNDFGNWPRDTHYCPIELAIWKDSFNVYLNFVENNIKDIKNNLDKQWKILEIETHNNNEKTEKLMEFSLTVPSLVLSFKLERNANFFSTILFAPFIVIALSVLSTFWVSALSYYKIVLITFQLLLNSVTLLGVGLTIPLHSKFVPNIVLLYSYSLVASLMCVILSVVVMYLSRMGESNSLPICVRHFIGLPTVKLFLFLSDVKQPPDEYESGIRNLDVKMENSWIFICEIIDRICFIFYLLLIIYSLFIY